MKHLKWIFETYERRSIALTVASLIAVAALATVFVTSTVEAEMTTITTFDSRVPVPHSLNAEIRDADVHIDWQSAGPQVDVEELGLVTTSRSKSNVESSPHSARDPGCRSSGTSKATATTPPGL